MKLTFGVVLFLMLLQASPVLPRTQETQNGIIDGVVLDTQTSLPVSGVNVSARDAAAPEKHCVSLPCPRPAAMATTDSAGRFSIPSLKLVSYRLEAWADGYVDVNLGSNVTTHLGAPISLYAAEDAKHLVIHISRTATLTGRILDDRGLPATNLSITAFKLTYNRDGFPAEGSTKTVQTDDRGEYRLYGMAPGRYYLRAGDIYTSRPGTPYAVTYYPNARTIEKASEIDVKAGSDVSLNWTVNRERLFSVSGRIIDDATGNPPANAGLAIAVCSDFYPGGIFLSTSRHDPATGVFALSNVRANRYLLVAGNTERPASAETFIEVTDHDIENVILKIAAPVSLPGKVTYVGSATVPTNTLASVRILMNRSVPTDTQCGSVSGTGPLFQRTGAEPTFHVDGLMRNQDYRVQATGLPPDMYVAKLLYSGNNVTNGVIHISDGNSGSFEIVLHSGAGKVHGHIQHSDGSSAAGALAVLVPKQRDRRELYKPAIADASGDYWIEGVTPGEYQLFSFMTKEQYHYFNPRIIESNKLEGRAVTIAEFSNQSIDLNVIPEETN